MTDIIQKLIEFSHPETPLHVADFSAECNQQPYSARHDLYYIKNLSENHKKGPRLAPNAIYFEPTALVAGTEHSVTKL